jgi:hypothetical protein
MIVKKAEEKLFFYGWSAASPLPGYKLQARHELSTGAW